MVLPEVVSYLCRSYVVNNVLNGFQELATCSGVVKESLLYIKWGGLPADRQLDGRGGGDKIGESLTARGDTGSFYYFNTVLKVKGSPP